MIDFWSPMQSKIEGELCIIHGKANGSSFTWRIQALELCSPLLKPNQESKEEKQREESNMKKFKRMETVGHISSTSWSPFYTYYISFQILGSQKSNALNSVQIEAKMKKLWPLEDDYTMLKDNFASCEITNSTCEIKVQLAKWTLPTCEIFESHVSTCEIHLCNPRYLWPTLLDFFLHIFFV